MYFVQVHLLKAGGLGDIGHDQLEWLEGDVKHLKHSTPIVVFAHIPLWTIYLGWGWGTDDSEQALSYLKKFGSVSVLNGHIHQVMQKVEGNVTFHTAMSTAFPQPAPGQGPSPGPMKVPADKLRSVLGITNVNFVRGKHTLAVVEFNLAGRLNRSHACQTGDEPMKSYMLRIGATWWVAAQSRRCIRDGSFKLFCAGGGGSTRCHQHHH